MKKYDNVWDAIEIDSAQAEDMKTRSSLMIELRQKVAQQKLSEAKAAELFNVSSTCISDLLQGRINLFSADRLKKMAAAARSS